MSKPKPLPIKKGQESVWDYPRPPKLEKVTKTIEIHFNEARIAQSNRAYRVLETSHPPSYYLPLEDIRQEFLVPSDRITYCEWKGEGSYYHLKVNGKVSQEAAWFYSRPSPDFLPIKNHLSFYAQRVDRCLVNDEPVIPQPGGFYGGWITQDIVGPFKGIEGSWGW